MTVMMIWGHPIGFVAIKTASKGKFQTMSLLLRREGLPDCDIPEVLPYVLNFFMKNYFIKTANNFQSLPDSRSYFN